MNNVTVKKGLKKSYGSGMKMETKKALVGVSFILPNFIGFFCFVLIPVLLSLILSFSEWDGFNPMKFVGFQNFVRIFHDKVFIGSIWKTTYFAAFTVLFSMGIALGLAVLLNQKIKGRGFFRYAIFFPYVASSVAVSVVFNALFQKDFGLINTVLRMVGVANPPGWLASTQWVIPTLIIVHVWKNMGYFMIIYLAALQDISEELYEAARIDGAGKWHIFKKITWPLLTPSTFFVVMMLTINSFKAFDLIFLMTEGGPGTASTMLSQYIYNQAFIYWNYGTSSAAGMMLFVLVAFLTIAQFRLEKKFVNHV